MSEYLRYIKQEWRDEIPVRIRGWWHRHWWPSHIRMLERERNDWKRWLVDCEERFSQIDPLAACIGYGITYQEAIDIVDMAVSGRDCLDELHQDLYDTAAQGIKGE